MNTKINISHVNNMHNQWLRTLGFYKTELAIQKGILNEIAGKNTGAELMKDVEHFENQFTIQNEKIDEISHDIHSNISLMAQQASASKAGYIDGDLVAQHSLLGQKADDQARISNGLVSEFRKFAERTL